MKKNKELKIAGESNLEKKDWIRLNVENVSEIKKLIEEKAKEYWGLEATVNINVTFGQVSNSHGSPIGKKTNWSGTDKNYPFSFLGWYGRIVGSLINYKSTRKFSTSVSEILFNQYSETGFRGFHTSSGCLGNTGGRCPMDIGFYFFLEDFPKLAESYKLFKIESQRLIDYENKRSDVCAKADDYSFIQPDVVRLNDAINELQAQSSKLIASHRKKYHLDNPLVRPILSPRFEALKELFKSYDYEN